MISEPILDSLFGSPVFFVCLFLSMRGCCYLTICISVAHKSGNSGDNSSHALIHSLVCINEWLSQQLTPFCESNDFYTPNQKKQNLLPFCFLVLDERRNLSRQIMFAKIHSIDCKGGREFNLNC